MTLQLGRTYEISVLGMHQYPDLQDDAESIVVNRALAAVGV